MLDCIFPLTTSSCFMCFVFLPTISAISLDSFDDGCCVVRRSLERLTRGIIGTRRRKGTTLYVVAYCSETLQGWEVESQKQTVIEMIQQRRVSRFFRPCMCFGYVLTCLVRERNGHHFEWQLCHDVAFVLVIGPLPAQPGHIWKTEIWINLKHVARKGSWED